MADYGPKPVSAPSGAIILHPGDDISAIVNAAPTGATFYFEAGTYHGVSLAPKDGQTFIGAEGAILNGSAVLTDWSQSGNLWVIGGQTQQGRVHPNAEFEAGTQRPGYPETVFLDNTPLKAVDALSKVVPGTFFFDYAADKIYIANNPTGHTVEAGKLTDAFHGNATNVTVENLVIEKYDPQIQDGAIQGGQGWIIRDNEVRLNYSVGITVRGDGGQIVGNYVHDNGQMGLGGSGDNILVEGNEIARNGYWSGIDPLWEGGGTKFANTDNLVVRGNYVHDNKGTGLWTDINNIHTLYEDNVVVHNTINGISHEISYDAVIRNNTLVGNGYGDTRGWGWGSDINIQNSQNVEVYGNRVDMTGGGNGIVMIQQDRGSGTYGTYTTTGNDIHDNIVVDRDGHGFIGGFYDYNASGMLNGGNTWTNNHYYLPDDGGRFQWGGSKNFSQFQAAVHETGSISQTLPDTSNWVTTTPAGPTTPPSPAPTPTPTEGANITVGTGSDVLVLKITQDAYQGDSQYAVSVDGKQIGPTLTAQALHGSGAVDTVQVKGDWAVGSHTVSVALLNDLWVSTTGGDRNIHVESATYDGAPVAGGSFVIPSGTKSFTVTDTTAAPGPTPAPTPTPTEGANITVGTGSDVLVLKITQDAYQGDSQYAVSVDGKQISATLTAQALHGSGAVDTVQVKGDWAAGSHTVSVALLNDLWVSTTGGDRNIHVESATYDGAPVAGGSFVIPSGTKSFTVTDTTAAPGPTPAPTPTPPDGANITVGTGSDVLVLKITQDAYQGDSQYAVSVDGKQIGATLTAQALHGSGAVDTVQVKGDWAAGSHTVSVALLNDLWVSTTGGDRNIHVESATYDGAPVAGGNFVILSGTKSFTVTDTTAAPGPTPPPTPTINNITGTSRSDVINGTNGDDLIHGARGNDDISGHDGSDLIVGGWGRDTLSGGSGDDHFIFASAYDSKITAPDLIQDYQSGDVIDCSKIDAQSGLGGDQAFTLVAGAFTAPGQLHVAWDSANNRTFIEGNVDGNLHADFRIEVVGQHAFDFLL